MYLQEEAADIGMARIRKSIKKRLGPEKTLCSCGNKKESGKEYCDKCKPEKKKDSFFEGWDKAIKDIPFRE